MAAGCSLGVDTFMSDEDLAAFGTSSRRDFVKKMVALGFALPLMSTIALEVGSGGVSGGRSGHLDKDRRGKKGTHTGSNSGGS
jgi:hypothetical protein